MADEKEKMKQDMGNIDIVFTSSYAKNKTNYPNLTQEFVLDELYRAASYKDIKSAKIDDEILGKIKYCFFIDEEEFDFKEMKQKCQTGSLTITVSKKLFGTDDNIKKLEEISSKTSSVRNINKDKLKKLTKGTLKVGAAIVIVAGAVVTTVGLSAIVGSIIDDTVVKEEMDTKITQEQQFYTNQNGDDVRTLPNYADNGYRDGNIYHASDGKKYLIDTDGRYIELSSEDYRQYLEDQKPTFVIPQEEEGKTY